MTIHQHSKIRSSPSIADSYCDLLDQLDDGRRQGMIRRLSVGFYEGWSPTRAELSVLVDFELGRISEEEFFATQRAANPAASAQGARDGMSTDPDAAGAGRRYESNLAVTPIPVGSAKSGRRAAFNVDCGELAGRFRFVATRLRGAGWTVRDEVNYRMVFLEYELLPVVPADPEALVTLRPVPFDATILCVPDRPAPWSADDGRSIRHIVGPQGISGSRGPWPVAKGVRLIKFVISRQPTPGTRTSGNPAGVLLVDMAGWRAAWRPVTGRRPARVAQN